MSKFQIWMMAIRPKTLPAAISPVLVGTAFAIEFEKFKIFPALAAFLGALLLQIAANLANDYFDFLKGYDTEDRIGPIRVSAAGLLPINELRNGLIINILISILLGFYLIWVGGILILLIGFFSIIFAIGYSGGPVPLAENGLGDLFVFIFFGLIAVNGTYYVQANEVNNIVIIGSIPIGFLITAILVVNNYRDIETDKKTGKVTVAVLLGHKFTRVYYIFLLLISYLIPIFFALFQNFSLWIILPLSTIPLAFSYTQTLFSEIDGLKLNRALAGTAQLSLLYSILFSLGIVL